MGSSGTQYELFRGEVVAFSMANRNQKRNVIPEVEGISTLQSFLKDVVGTRREEPKSRHGHCHLHMRLPTSLGRVTVWQTVNLSLSPYLDSVYWSMNLLLCDVLWPGPISYKCSPFP